MKRQPKPSAELVNSYLEKWNNNARYTEELAALDHLFATFSENTDLGEVMVKICTLNEMYHTRVNNRDYHALAHVIIGLKIDEKLNAGDLKLVNELCNAFRTKDLKGYLSFASKYCAFHRSDVFSPYDQFARKALEEYCRTGVLTGFNITKLKEYDTYCAAIQTLKNQYHLDFTPRELDHWLWRMGMDFEG